MKPNEYLYPDMDPKLLIRQRVNHGVNDWLKHCPMFQKSKENEMRLDHDINPAPMDITH